MDSSHHLVALRGCQLSRPPNQSRAKARLFRMVSSTSMSRGRCLAAQNVTAHLYRPTVWLSMSISRVFQRHHEPLPDPTLHPTHPAVLPLRNVSQLQESVTKSTLACTFKIGGSVRLQHAETHTEGLSGEDCTEMLWQIPAGCSQVCHR